MNLTLPIAAWLSLIVACFAWGVIIGAAVMLDVIQSGRPRHIAPMHVSLSRLADPDPLPGELSPFPGEAEFSHSEWYAVTSANQASGDQYWSENPWLWSAAEAKIGRASD